MNYFCIVIAYIKIYQKKSLYEYLSSQMGL